MKNKIILSSFLSLSAWAANVDTKESKINWHATKVTGEHVGTIAVKSGTLDITKGELKGGTIAIDMNSIDCTDIDNPEYKTKFSNHMKSEDFFNVAKFPESTLKITKVEKKDGKTFVTGDFTILGSTHSETFPVELKEENKNTVLTTKLVLDRTKWNIKYGSGKFFKGLGDKMIHDNFDLTIKIVAK